MVQGPDRHLMIQWAPSLSLLAAQDAPGQGSGISGATQHAVRRTMHPESRLFPSLWIAEGIQNRGFRRTLSLAAQSAGFLAHLIPRTSVLSFSQAKQPLFFAITPFYQSAMFIKSLSVRDDGILRHMWFVEAECACGSCIFRLITSMYHNDGSRKEENTPAQFTFSFPGYSLNGESSYIEAEVYYNHITEISPWLIQVRCRPMSPTIWSVHCRMSKLNRLMFTISYSMLSERLTRI